MKREAVFSLRDMRLADTFEVMQLFEKFEDAQAMKASMGDDEEHYFIERMEIIT